MNCPCTSAQAIALVELPYQRPIRPWLGSTLGCLRFHWHWVSSRVKWLQRNSDHEMIYYILMRMMSAPFAFITAIFLFASLPTAILMNSQKRLGRYCWIWAAIPFVVAFWMVMINDYHCEPAEVVILFIVQYPFYWVAYFLIYRFFTRKRPVEIMPLILNEDSKPGRRADHHGQTAECQGGKSEPRFCPKCGQLYYESDYSTSRSVWLCSACKSPLQNSRGI